MKRVAAKHSLFRMLTKYGKSSSATPGELETAAMIIASLKSWSCFDKDIREVAQLGADDKQSWLIVKLE
jgi:hypothetical protein